jgi:F-type H+-transporting ATPase subunit a
VIPLVATPGSHPTVTIGGCGQWCTFDYQSLLVALVAAIITIVIVMLVARAASSEHPGKFQVGLELLFDYVRTTTQDFVGEIPPVVIPLSLTVFLFILIANWLDAFPLDQIPDIGTGPNADLNLPAAMAIIVFIASEVYSLRALGLRGFLRRFTTPLDANIAMRIAFIPIHIITEIAKPVSLSLRLFGNIFALAVMVFLIEVLLGQGLSSLIGFAAPVIVAPILLAAWKLFDVFVIGSLQAYIFMVLTIIYFAQAREGAEEHEATH